MASHEPPNVAHDFFELDTPTLTQGCTKGSSHIKYFLAREPFNTARMGIWVKHPCHNINEEYIIKSF